MPKSKRSFQSTLSAFIKDESGATSIEYAIMAGVIAIGIIGGLKLLGGENGEGWMGFSKNVTDEL